jgi:hypothetical protein
VIKWRDRFAAHGLAGLGDEQRIGRSKVVDHAVIIAATLESPPAKLGVTHCSSRLLGKHLGIGARDIVGAVPFLLGAQRALPAVKVCPDTSSAFATAGIVWPSASIRSASRSLRMIRSGVCLRRFISTGRPAPIVAGA